MALDTTSSRTRSITAIGAGAVLFAVVGYFLLNKKSKNKPKKKPRTEMHPDLVKVNLDASLDGKSLHSPVEASSPVLNGQKFFTEKFEISIEKSIETSFVVKQVIENSENLSNSNNNLEQTKTSSSSSSSSSTSTSSDLSSELANLSSICEKPEKNDQQPVIVEKVVARDKPVVVKKQTKVKPTDNKKPSDTAPKAKKSKLKPVKNNETISDAKSDQHEKPFEDLVVYEFNFPRKLCGKLIGKNGVHVDFIRSKTKTQIAVRNDPNVEEQQIVCVSGLVEDVDHALDIIRSRFPPKHYAQISFKPITKPIIYRRHNPEKSVFSNSKVLVAPNMYVDVDSMPRVNDLVDVHVSAVVGPTHVFIQLPKNQSFANLQKLDQNMLAVYNSDESTPLMLEPIEYGAICAAPTLYGWHRAMVTNYLSRSQMLEINSDYKGECGMTTVKFLDYGGYLDLPSDQLRQLR